MFKNEYLEKVYNDCLLKNANEKEFLQSVLTFLKSIEKYLDLHPEVAESNLLARFIEPERLISFRVAWVDDNGKVQVNRGYRVQFNSAIGPYKGGIRLHPTVNQSIIKFLGFTQILKNSLTGLPMGGAKGGSDFDPKGKSDNEIMRFCQAFISELYRHIGADLDVPAGDIGTGAREVGFMFGMYKKLKNEFTGTFTGKGLAFGGSLARPEATGFGLVFYTERMLNKVLNESFKNKKVVISGSGNVAIYACQKVQELGGKVIAMSDSSGFVYDEEGIDLDILKPLKEIERGRISEYVKKAGRGKFFNDSKGIWNIKCDIALPCATQNELDLDSAKELVKNGCICVSEGANMPSTPDAINYFEENKILFGPAIAANCGGVMVSGFEMSQNSMRLSWTFDEVVEKLKSQMEKIFDAIYECIKEYNEPFNFVLGANVVGFDKVKKAMISEGVI